MRRRNLRVLSISAAIVVAAIAACGFPDVGFAPAGGDGGPSTNEGGAETSSGDAADDAKILVDGGDPDALIVRDAGQKVDAAGCASGCDCDGDGFNNNLKAGCNSGGANDCDDEDPRSQPGRGFLIDKAESPQFGDWNCSGKLEPLYDELVDCTKLNPGKSTCDDKQGYAGAVGCGNFGTLIKCKTVPVPPLNLTSECVNGAMVPMTQQACK